MKKIILLTAALAAGTLTASAQVEIGVKISPSITSLRADGPPANPFSGGDSKVGFGGGLIVDYFFGENYAFGTGLFLTGKGGSYTYSNAASAQVPLEQNITQKLTTQYLELPATIKLFTNEVAPDVKLYFQLGGSLAVPITARIDGEKFYTDKFTATPTSIGKVTEAYSHVFYLDANALLGLGAEYQLGTRTKVLAGLSYHRGLIDLDRYFEKERGFKDVNIRNSVFALDLGMKF